MANRTARARGALTADASTEARFGKHVTPMPNGCWAWGNDLDHYGNFAVHSGGGMKTQVQAHRFAYETIVGPIPDGQHLHHICENPGCVNPAHLVPLTPSDHKHEHVRLRRAS